MAINEVNVQENRTPDTGSDSPASLEKGGERRHSVGDGVVPHNLREDDFRTRNGLNMKSFQRRVYSQHHQRAVTDQDR